MEMRDSRGRRREERSREACFLVRYVYYAWHLIVISLGWGFFGCFIQLFTHLQNTDLGFLNEPRRSTSVAVLDFRFCPLSSDSTSPTRCCFSTKYSLYCPTAVMQTAVS
jgi:hypothetical protein